MKTAILICIALALFIICFLIKINLGVKNIERVVKMPDCLNCEIRKFYANAFDTHFDYKDCPIDCKAKKKVREENQKYIINNGKDYEFER